MNRIRNENLAALPLRRRDLLRAAAVVVVAASAGAGTSVVAATKGSGTSVNSGIRAFKLYTGPDNESHVLEGTVA
jgi:hypothetical protein